MRIIAHNEKVKQRWEKSIEVEHYYERIRD